MSSKIELPNAVTLTVGGVNVTEMKCFHASGSETAIVSIVNFNNCICSQACIKFTKRCMKDFSFVKSYSRLEAHQIDI